MKYGFIGCGNMGSAVARAVCKGAGAGDVLLANRTPAKAEKLAGELGCACGTNEQVAGICDFIFLGVKPQMMADMLDELSATLESRAESRPFVLVTMAAGLSMQQIRMMAGSGYPIIRMMPNTPVALGDGMIQYCSDDVEPEKMAEWLAAMAPAGRLDAVPEGMMDAASAVSGCGPAWAYQFIEALADGGVDIAPTTDNIDPEVLKKVDEVKEKIISGEIEVPTDKESFDAKYGDVYQLDD